MTSEPDRHPPADSAPNARFNRAFLLLPFLLGLLLTVCSRLFNLTKYGLWEDEVFSFRTARLGWVALFQQTLNDVVHPPLFYMLLKLWILAGGESLLWVKTLPVIFAVAAIGPLYLLCRDLRIKFAEFCLAVIFISLNSYLIYYAQELRMYSLMAFFSLLSMWLFVRFLRDNSGSITPLILLFAVNLLLVYTQYFGWMTVLAEGVVVVFYDRAKLKAVFVQIVAVGLCFLPWCFLVASVVANKGGLGGNLGWIDKPGLSAIPQLMAEFQGTSSFKHATIISCLIFLPPLLIWLWHVYRERKREDALIFAFLGSVTALPILIAFLVSQISATSIWVDRYFMAAAIPYILLLAASVSRIKNVWISRSFVTLMVCWSLGVGAWNIFNRQTRVNWISFSNRISESENISSQPVFVTEDWTQMPLEQLLGRDQMGQPIVRRVGKIEEIGDREFWLSYRETAWKEPEFTQEKLRRMTCSVDDELTNAVDNDKIHLIHATCNK